MKKGVSVWSFPENYNLSEIFKTAKDAGFDGVEVALAEDGEVNLNSTREDMKKISAMAKEYGIELYSVSSGLYWKYSLTSNDANVREKAKSVVRKQLEIANWLNCDTILVIPGTVCADFVPNCEVVDYDVAYDRALAAINELKIYAEEQGVVIGLENVWNKFLLSPLEMRDFIDRIDSRFVGAYFDVGNVLIEGYPEQWIKILNKRIKKVHFKDYRRQGEESEGFVGMLDGDVNYPAVMDAFEKTGYDDWVTAEVAVYRYYRDQGVYNASNSMSRILGQRNGDSKNA